MPSFSNSISLLSMKLTRRQGYLSSAQAVQKHLKTHDKTADHSPSQKLMRYYDIQRHHLRGRDCYTMQPRNCNEFSGYRVSILYIHGGAYIHEMTLRQWEFLAAMITAGAAKGLNITFTIPIYSLVTPETLNIHQGHGHAHAVLGFLKAAYRGIAEGRGRNRDIVVMGEEAGGGLAYALAVSLDSKSGLPPPRRVILLSPWLDVHLQNPLIKNLQRSDPTNRLEGLKEAGRLFAQGTDPTDPILAPLHAKIDKGLMARIYVWTSDADVCQADCLTLVVRASRKGIDMGKLSKDRSKRYVCMHGLYPSWMISSWTPEAAYTISEVLGVINEAVLSQRSPSVDVDKRRKSSTGRGEKARSISGASSKQSTKPCTSRCMSTGIIPQLSSTKPSSGNIPRTKIRSHSTAEVFSLPLASGLLSGEELIPEIEPAILSNEEFCPFSASQAFSDDEGRQQSSIPDTFPCPTRQTNSDENELHKKLSPTAGARTFPFPLSLSSKNSVPRSPPNSSSVSFQFSSSSTPLSDTFDFNFGSLADLHSPKSKSFTSVGSPECSGSGSGLWSSLESVKGPLVIEELK